MGKIFKIIVNCILVLIIIVLVAYFALRAMDKIRIYNVETGSMEDKIHTGDYILLIRKDDYQVGDVITFTVNDYFITHRIISMKDGKITTKGDANNLEDADITKNQIVGKAIYWGGILNYIINYKFVIAAALVGLYLLSCYFGEDEEDVIFDETESVKNNELIDDINEPKIEEISDEPKSEEEIIIIEDEEINTVPIEEKQDKENKEIIIEEITEVEETKKDDKALEVKSKRGRPKKKAEEKINVKKDTKAKKMPKKNTKKKKKTTKSSVKTSNNKITNIVRTSNKKEKNK